MGPPPTPPPQRVAESEIVAATSRFAFAGDFPAAARTLDLAGPASEQARVGAKVVSELAPQNAEAAAALALALPSGPDQTAAIETAVHAWAQHDAPAALRWALEMPDSIAAQGAQRAIAGELVHQNPRAALDRITALAASPARDDLLGYAAAAWARHDVGSTLAWLRQLPDNELRQRMTSSVAFEIAQTSPDRAIALAESIPAGRNRWLIFSAIAQTWIAKDPKTAMAWVNRLPAGAARDAALAGVNTGLGVGSSRPAILATDTLASRADKSRSARNNPALTGSPEINSPAFTAWLATQPLTLSRDEAILEFVRQRGAADLGAIGNWVATLPVAATRQRAIEIYFDEALRNSPANAATWLRSLPSSDRSDEMIEKTARQWLQTDPRAAETWLQETPLPAFRKEEILRQAPH